MRDVSEKLPYINPTPRWEPRPAPTDRMSGYCSATSTSLNTPHAYTISSNYLDRSLVHPSVPCRSALALYSRTDVLPHHLPS